MKILFEPPFFQRDATAYDYMIRAFVEYIE